MKTSWASQSASNEAAEANREQSFIRTYIELTDVTESQARAVFMFAGCRENISPEAGYNHSLQPSRLYEQHSAIQRVSGLH